MCIQGNEGMSDGLYKKSIDQLIDFYPLRYLGDCEAMDVMINTTEYSTTIFVFAEVPLSPFQSH